MSDLVMVEKVCKTCGVSKPLSEFWKAKDGLHGVRAHCADCQRPKTYASIAQRRARLGEDEFRRQNRKSVARARLLGTADPRPNQARTAATSELIERHPDEMAALVRIERQRLGLDPNPNRAAS